MSDERSNRSRDNRTVLKANRPGAYGRSKCNKFETIDFRGLPTISQESARELANEHSAPVNEERCDREIAAARRAMRRAKGLPI
jgi:hypothetical protein